jgi:hypothetical protein
MVELVNWPMWVDPPILPSFHVIYWWAVLVLVVGAVGVYKKGEQRTEWQEYWQERGRTLGGNMEEIGQYMLGGRGGGAKASSVDRIAAGVLQQIADVVKDLTAPPAGTHIASCMLVPELDAGGEPLALQAVAYNQNSGRHFSRIAIDAPGPATEAFRSGTPKVLSDTSVPPYDVQFAGRDYRSVMAYPVNIGHGAGRRLAIVTIDATVVGHFHDADRTEKGIDAAIFPLLKLVGLLRIAELKGGRRGSTRTR